MCAWLVVDSIWQRRVCLLRLGNNWFRLVSLRNLRYSHVWFMAVCTHTVVTLKLTATWDNMWSNWYGVWNNVGHIGNCICESETSPFHNTWRSGSTALQNDIMVKEASLSLVRPCGTHCRRPCWHRLSFVPSWRPSSTELIKHYHRTSMTV